MQEKFTPYLNKQFSNPAIEEQYIVLPNDILNKFQSLDPLAEDSHQPVKGLIHKYGNRALIKVSYRCAAHCRFCTRIRLIGSEEGDINDAQIQEMMGYLKKHTEITDVILSGGDPLYTPRQTLQLLNELDKIESIRVIRIGTRLPVHNPDSFKTPLLKQVRERITEIAAQSLFIFSSTLSIPMNLRQKLSK